MSRNTLDGLILSFKRLGNHIFSLFTENGASIAVLSSIQSGHGNNEKTGKSCRPKEFYKDEEVNILSGGKPLQIILS